MSLWASNCYRFASRGRRPPLRAPGGTESPTSASTTTTTTRSGEQLALRSRKQRASLAIACSGFNAAEASESACHRCWRCVRDDVRPASVTRFSDVQSQLELACAGYARALTLWTPPAARRLRGTDEDNVALPIASCDGNDERRRGSHKIDDDDDDDASVSDQNCNRSSTSQCEDLVTALELYRHHLLSVLLTPKLCDSAAAAAAEVEAAPSPRSAASSVDVVERRLRLREEQYRRIWRHPEIVIPMTSLRHLHTSARRWAGGAPDDDSDDKKAVTTKTTTTWGQRVKNVPGALKRAPGAIWRELVHLYHGFRLLATDIKIASKLIRQILNGSTLTRSEKNQVYFATLVYTSGS